MKIMLFWIPRILMLIFAFLIMVFSFSVIEMNLSIWQKIYGFIIHSSPTFLILFSVIISWRKPLLGSILLGVLFILFTLFFKTYSKPLAFAIVSLPILIGILLYLLEYFFIKKNK